MIKVAVIGAKGRMGTNVCAAVNGAADLELVAQLDLGDEINAANLAGAEVAVDFTHPSVTEANVHALLDAGICPVVGTTGWNTESYDRVADHARDKGIGALIAPNFALSAVLAMDFARQAARYFESAEVIELHHPNKVDAPSGTAVATAQGIAAARAAADLPPIPDATEMDPNGARGAIYDGVHVHAVRLRGLVAHEEILFGNPGEQLTIRTDCFDRISFMSGVLLGVRKVQQQDGLTIGLDKVL